MGASAPRETVDKSAVQGLLNLTTLGEAGGERVCIRDHVR